MRHNYYQRDFIRVQNFVSTLNDYKARLVATGNKPNELIENVRWQALADIDQQLIHLQER